MEGDTLKILFVVLMLPGVALSYTPTTQTNCSATDLRHSLGEVRDQGKVSWCYAFTAADNLAYTFNLPEQISAADIALNYNESAWGRVMDTVLDNGNPHETGFTKAALLQGMQDGYCPESVFPSENWNKVINGQRVSVKMSEAMKDIAQLHKNRANLTVTNLPFYFEFPNVGPAEFVSLLQTKKLRTFYSNLRKLACKNDRVPFDARWKVHMVFRNKNIFQRVNEQLNLGRLVAMDYDARILENRDHQGLKLSELHTSSIVGRRWNKERNTCEYLIRDSHGVQCSRYDARYECEQGNVWLGESEIYKNLTSIVFMRGNPIR
jgi:hypothetical protein